MSVRAEPRLFPGKVNSRLLAQVPRPQNSFGHFLNKQVKLILKQDMVLFEMQKALLLKMPPTIIWEFILYFHTFTFIQT